MNYLMIVHHHRIHNHRTEAHSGLVHVTRWWADESVGRFCHINGRHVVIENRKCPPRMFLKQSYR